MSFFKRLTQTTDAPSKLREKSMNETLVLGPFHTLHVCFLQLSSFLPDHNKRGRLVDLSV